MFRIGLHIAGETLAVNAVSSNGGPAKSQLYHVVHIQSVTQGLADLSVCPRTTVANIEAEIC